MSKKILRLGYTESDLLLTYFVVNIAREKIDIMDDEFLKINTENMLKWFYTSSGFYDKSMKKIDINCFFSENFVSYMNRLINIIKNSNMCLLHFHEYIKDYYRYFGELVEFFQDKIFSEIWYIDLSKFNMVYDQYYNLNEFMQNKKVLIINPLSELMKEQFNNGNVYNANNPNNDLFPPIEKIVSHKNKYTFFNNGPNNNIAETYFNFCKEIANITEEYDCAVISCGAYSCLIASFISNKLNKDVFVIGGLLNNKFALKTQRLNEHNPGYICNSYWIDIPDHLKPEGYKNIENGCYW